MKKLLFISNRVMHYRVSVYNYFARRFREHGWEFVVRSNELQRQNPYPLEFDFKEVPLNFLEYRREIKSISPSAIILFLHLKDCALWPLIHYIKLNRVPVAFWTKGANLDHPESRFRYLLFNYMHSLCDALILYSKNEMKYIHKRNHRKVFVANNTLNEQDFPVICASKEEIKKEFEIPFEKVVLFVGRMGIDGDRKKVSHLIEVFRELNMPGAGLVIVGSGMSEEIKAQMYGKNTLYLGELHDPEQQQISKIFKMADLFCIPGHVGLGLNQAFFWGLPTVTEAGCQPPEIHHLVDGYNGFVVPENDITALRQRIIYLLKDDLIRRQFGENARETILKNGSVEGMFTGFKACVDALYESNVLPDQLNYVRNS